MSVYYVDPAINANSGAGTIGSPYGDLQYALNTITRDATNGDIIYIKAGTPEYLTAALSLATYGTPTLNGPLSLRGYASVAGDDGIGEIDGSGAYSICTATPDGLSYRNLRMGNCGSATILTIGRFGGLYNCDIHTTTGNGLIGSSDVSPLVNCIIRGISGVGVQDSPVFNSLFMCESGRNFSTAYIGSASNTVSRSMFFLTGASNGMSFSNGASCTHNSLLAVSASASATGITIARPIRSGGCIGNIVEGFVTGITQTNVAESGFGILHNAAYNNTTNYGPQGEANLTNLDSEVLTESAFVKSGSVTWANRLNYFAPKDIGNVRAGVFGYLSKGAVPFSGGGGFPLSRILNRGVSCC